LKKNVASMADINMI